LENSSAWSKSFPLAGTALGLRGPAANDPAAKVLHTLAVGLLIFILIENSVVVPLVSPKRTGSGILAFLYLLVFVATLVLLRRGFVRQASLVYVAGTWLLTSALIVLTGGIHSIGLVVYATLPISAAWLLGYAAALWTAGACLAVSLAVALLEMGGVGPLWYSRGHPLGLWSVVVQSMVIGAVPVAQILRILKEALAQSQLAQEALRVYQGRLEELVQQRTADLQAANKAKSVFLANMSHELRTPLHAILGFSTLVHDDPGLSEEHRRDLDIVNRNGERLLDLIDDVLDVVKIESGMIVVENVPFDLRDLIEDTLEMMRPRAHAKNLDLLFAWCSEFPRFARADAVKLRQVLVNLIGNAVKYTERGCVFLRLNAKAMDDSRCLWLTFEVLDTGIGIALEDQARIFDPFVQAGKPGSQKGTGLGLSISRQFVHLMGGTIQVESTPGKGSMFRVDLPVEQAEEFEVMPPPATEKKPAAWAPGQPAYRILIVEDERENWLLLQRLLQDAGCSVQVVEDGLQAVETFRIWRPNLIWMDLRLPLMGGLEAARQIREMDGGREVKIVAVSASAREEVLAAGLDDFVRKPYRPNEIFDCMARQLGLRYVYSEDAPASGKELVSALRPEDLAALPEDLCGELTSALIALNVERITTLISRVSELDSAVGAVLARYADRFAFTEIVEALDGANVLYSEKSG
jgi:signal transduction histidine kinase/CheY-like chemotaxis protein